MVITGTMIISGISVLVTAAVMLAAFSYKNGQINNELRNQKEQMLTIKEDLEKDIEKKADKDIVELIFVEIRSIKDLLNQIISREIEGK